MKQMLSASTACCLCSPTAFWHCLINIWNHYKVYVDNDDGTLHRPISETERSKKFIFILVIKMLRISLPLEINSCLIHVYFTRWWTAESELLTSNTICYRHYLWSYYYDIIHLHQRSNRKAWVIYLFIYFCSIFRWFLSGAWEKCQIRWLNCPFSIFFFHWKLNYLITTVFSLRNTECQMKCDDWNGLLLSGLSFQFLWQLIVRSICSEVFAQEFSWVVLLPDMDQSVSMPGTDVKRWLEKSFRGTMGH